MLKDISPQTMIHTIVRWAFYLVSQKCQRNVVLRSEDGKLKRKLALELFIRGLSGSRFQTCKTSWMI